MSFFDEFNNTTTKKGTTTDVKSKTTPDVAPTGSFFNEFTAKKDTTAVKPTPAPVVAPTETPISSLPRETISAPTGNEVLPVFDRIKDFTEKLLGINQKRTPADIIKDQQKAFESLVKNPSVQDTVDEFGNPVSPFKSVQTAREVRRSSIPTPKGIVEGLTDVSKSDVPFAGALLDAKDVGNVYLITQKLNNGKQITPEETVQLRDFFEKQDTLNKRRQGDAGYRVGETLRNSLTFMAELAGAGFAAPETGGTSIGGLIAEKGTLKATKEIATKMLADSVTRDLMTKQLKEYGIKAGQRSAVILGSQAGIHVPEDALTRMVGTPTFSNDMGSINVSVANDGQNVSDALINAFTGSLIETTSEFTGGIFEVLPKAVKNQLIKSAIIKATLEKNPGLSTNVITEFFKKAGWHGVIGEMGEEQIGNIMYGIANQMGISDTNFHVPTAKELAEQFVSFSLMGGFIKTLSTGYQKVIKDNVQKDLPKDVKELTDTLHGVVSTGVNTDTPSDVVRALKDAGIDQNTAVKIVMEHADNQGQVDITPEALQAEIDAFMGTQQDTTGQEGTPAPVTETTQETAPKEEAKKPVKIDTSMPFDLPSMDIKKEDLPKVEADWKNNYAEEYTLKQDDLKTLQSQLKTRKGESKRTTQARIDTISEQLKEMESEFLKKHAPDHATELEQLNAKQVPSQELINSYYKKYANDYNTPENDGMAGAVAHSEVISKIQEDGYTYEQARDIALEVMYKAQEEKNKKEPLVKKTRETKDDNAPTFETADFNETFDENPVIFKKGQFVIGRDGKVAEVVSGNDSYKSDHPLFDMNVGYLRTQVVGSAHDYIEYANQVRLATEEEVAQAKEYAKNNPIKEDTMAKIENEAKVTKKKTQKEKVKEVVAKKEKASIKEIADVTGILEPNVRRILGVGAKEGEFERVAEGIYKIKDSKGNEVAVIIPGDALETLPKLADEGFKADMVFLDIPYDTKAVRGGNRGVKYDLISVDQFANILSSTKKILRSEESVVIHMYSQAESGLSDMQKYNKKFNDFGFKVLGKGEYQKTFADGSPVTSPNGKVSRPEGILVFNQSGNAPATLNDLNFTLKRPKGYQTEKPAELLKSLIEMTTEEGDTVLDPFAGSGVTGAEAVKSGRKAVLVEKNKEVAEKITKPRVEGAVPKSTDITVGDVFDTGGVTNMKSPVTVTSIEGRTVKFKDADGVEYQGLENKVVRDFIKEGVWTKTEQGTAPIDNADEVVDNKDDEQGNKSNEISNPSEVSTGADLGRGSKTTSEISGYDRAAMLVQPRNGSSAKGTNGLTKGQRQLINQEVEGLLEAKDYSQNPDDYTDTDKDLMRAYSGAGGKESVGGEGQGLLNEYYTPQEVVTTLWNIAERLSPNMETAFEPSAGTGRIISNAPASVSVDGAEISKVSGTIAQVLNPDSTITIGDFQELFFDKKTNKAKTPQQYDVVIGNPPFGERAGFLKGKGEESTINRQEEYFIKRGLDMTKEGGHLIYVVNSSFLKTEASKGKQKIAQLGELVTAYRLPEGTFEDTSVGTDIVVFKKSLTTANSDTYLSNLKAINSDSYFENNPENILGTTELRKNRFGQTESYVKGDLASAMEKVSGLLPEPEAPVVEMKLSQVADLMGIPFTEITADVQEEQAKVVKENQPITKKNVEKVAKKVKEVKKKDTQSTLPKKNATELVIPAQDISNKKSTNPTEIQMLKRIDRDMSIPTPSTEEMKYLNVGKGGLLYPDAIYFSGEVVEKLDLLAGNKKFIVDNYGEAQYEKQLKGLEAKIPATFPLKDIIFDPIDRHVAQLKAKTTNRFGEEVDGTILTAFNSYVRNNDVAMSPRVTKYDIIRYVNGEQAAKDTKPIMGNIKNDAKRLFNHFIKHELDAKVQKDIEEKYNREKNGYVHPDYSQIPVEVKDMAKQFRGDDFKMSQTQKNGVGFLVNKGSGLIAYGVGVGKTHTLAIATKANMDKGWTKRPLFTVPKTTIDKTWIGTLHEMFPTLKINNLEGLQAPVIARLKRERGEDPKNWIQDGEMTVISHEGLLRLGFKEDELRSAAGDLQDAIWKDESTKRAKEGQKNKYDEILGNAQKYVTDVMLSDLGFDHVSVDEVHNFRKIFQGAKPENLDENGNAVGRKRYGNVVGGTPSKRAQQLFLVSQYIQKKYGNRNVFLASATPFENHATEVYNILSLVARDRMKQMGILNINDFFSVFANFEVELDRKLNGEWLNSEKMKSFSNVQALQSLIKEFIDYQEDPTLVRPERRVITPHLQMSEKQIENLGKIQNLLSGTKEIVNDSQAFAEDSKTMYDVSSEGAEDGAFLKASTYSIANSVSPYFIKEYAGTVTDAKTLVEDSPKIKYTLEALKTLKEDPKTKDFGTFVFFGKMGVEYHPMIAEYFAKELGYKPEQVAYLSGNVTDEQKENIKERFNNGEIKVLLGGDQTKEGIDLQNNGFMTINLALGWNPTQIAQVEGRVWRQGNKRSIAPLVYPLVENSGDAMIYNKFEEKGGRINDLFSYAGTMFDIGEVDPAEKKLTLLTDPKDKAKMQIEIDKTVLYNERVLIDNDIKALRKLRGDLNESKESIGYYEEQSKLTFISDERKKEYKAEKKNAESRVARLEAKLKEKNITNLDETIGDMEGKMVDLDNQIKKIDDTYEPLLAKFTKEYQENIKKRKTLSQHMDEIKGLISELKERTPEEIKAIREQKIADLEAIKTAVPEFQRIEDTAEVISEKAKLREDATVLMLDMQNNVGTEEERAKRYAELMDKWKTLGSPEFQRTTTSKEPTISFEEGKKRLESYQKRLGLKFDVDFADVIFTGEYLKNVVPVKAYAVTYNNKITLTDNIKLTTADHEMVHIVVDNIDKISAFEGITRDALLRAQNGGKEVDMNDKKLVEKLNEELAIGFQNKVLGEEQSSIPMIIRRFYDKLQILLTDMFRALGMEVNVIKDFYNKMATAKGNSQVILTSSPILDRRAQYERNGVKGLDFSFEQMKEMDDIRRAGFERMVELAKDYSIDLKRKDINYIENLVAISRDIYLKDPIEFKQADEFMKIGDTRRMKKEILDKKFSDMLSPYYDLSKSEQTDVNMVLMQGDKDTKEYTESELEQSKLSPAQIRAYFAVRKSFNTAHQLLIDEMERTGVKPEEIETFKKERTGYMPHKWKYRFAIKTQTIAEGADPEQPGNWKTQTMDVYETARKANKVFEQLKKDNKDPEHVRYVNDTLDSLEVDFFSEQRFSFENMKSMIAKAKTGADVKDEMIGAMRDIIKEKGFGRHFIKRTGIQGYETKEVPEIMANYFAGLNGFVTKMEAGKQYYGVLEKIDARRQKNFYTWVRDSIAYDMGNTKEWNTLKKFAFVYSLANDMSFLLTNATQNWVVGVGELTKLYNNKASKIVGAEATLMKATADWATGNITPEERQVIEGLIKVGRLGGEMTSELMGFKNNPIYASMGSWFNTAIYSTTAFVEKNVNRVPAFLSARRILKAQGLSDKEANEEALKVSDDINFRGGKQHRPVFMRGRIGTIFVFNTYIRSFLYQLSRDVKEKEFMSIAKKMFYTALLGGTSALPLAELIMKIVRAILPPDPEEETKDELGTWELALKKGPINAFLNIDISSRVNINIFGVENIIKDPKNVLSWLGAVGSLIGKRLPDGVTLYQQDRYLEAFGKLLPDFLGNPLRAYNGHIYGVTTMSGNPLIDENGQEFKYTTYEAYVKALGYSPARESIAWDESNKQWEAKNSQSEKAILIQGKIKRQIREGDIEGARQTQQEGLASGDITDKSTDYVKQAVTEQVMQTKYDEWNAGIKSRPVLDKMERDIAHEIYGDKITKVQLTNVTRDFAFYRTFGFNDSLANEINKAQSTAQKVEILKKARENMTLEEFKAFWNKGRSVVKYEATSRGAENTGYVLISDALRKAYFAK